MAFDAAKRPKQRIAVIGSGVSGLSAAWLLAERHDVAVYERADRLGGHVNTVDVPLPSGESIPVDAGFIVYNEPAYPNLTALFAHVGVETDESCMSFGASMRGGEVEYSGQSLSSVFADRAKAASPRFVSMLVDIARFHGDARRAVIEGIHPAQSLAEFVAAKRYGRSFARDFLKPMASAIWSTPSERILDFSAAAFIQFYANHGLLQVLNLPVWRTVSGGAQSYVAKMSGRFKDVRLKAPVAKVTRTAAGVEVRDEHGHVDTFDAVVIAAHADAALAMLADASDLERSVLGAFQYQSNRAVVHFDPAHMPKRRRAWSSWNYIGDEGRAEVTYWMNRLQNLDCREEIFVTLNPLKPVREDLIAAEFDYEHPMFNLDAAAAQRRLWELQGCGGVWFCGAHFGQGFHEDGLQSGLAVAEALAGVRRPWEVANESARIHLAPILMAAE